MASAVRQPNGRKTIQFRGPDGKRHSLRLGEVNEKQANTVRGHVEALCAAKLAGLSIDAETAKWLAARPITFLEKLAGFRLIEKPAVPSRVLLAPFLKEYIGGRES